MRRFVGPGISALVTAGLFYGAAASDGWAVFWFLLLAVGGVGETVALARRARGDTLSETVWDTTNQSWARALLGVFMAWLSFHFVFQGRKERGDG